MENIGNYSGLYAHKSLLAYARAGLDNYKHRDVVWLRYPGTKLLLRLVYVALRTPTKGQLFGTYNRSMRECERCKGLRSKLSPKELW